MPRINSIPLIKGQSGGSPRRIKSADLTTSTTLDQNRFVEVFSVQATETESFAPGHGPQGEHTQSYSDLDLEDSGDNEITGEMRWEVYRDSSKNELMAIRDLESPTVFSSAVSVTPYKDKQPTPEGAIIPPKDGYLVLAVKVDNSTNDGNTASTSNSSEDVGLAYTRLST